MDRQEAALVVMGIEQRELLMAVKATTRWSIEPVRGNRLFFAKLWGELCVRQSAYSRRLGAAQLGVPAIKFSMSVGNRGQSRLSASQQPGVAAESDRAMEPFPS